MWAKKRDFTGFRGEEEFPHLRSPPSKCNDFPSWSHFLCPFSPSLSPYQVRASCVSISSWWHVMAFGNLSATQLFENRDCQSAQCHAVLRLPAAVDDPVRIIRAAQIQLRRWRREVANAPAVPRQRRAGEIVGEIIAARESLLRRSLEVHSPPTGVQSAHAGCRP